MLIIVFNGSDIGKTVMQINKKSGRNRFSIPLIFY